MNKYNHIKKIEENIISRSKRQSDYVSVKNKLIDNLYSDLKTYLFDNDEEKMSNKINKIINDIGFIDLKTSDVNNIHLTILHHLICECIWKDFGYDKETKPNDFYNVISLRFIENEYRYDYPKFQIDYSEENLMKLFSKIWPYGFRFVMENGKLQTLFNEKYVNVFPMNCYEVDFDNFCVGARKYSDGYCYFLKTLDRIKNHLKTLSK